LKGFARHLRQEGEMLSVVIAATDPDVLPALRKLLLAVVCFVMAGTIVDLLLLGHYEEAWQWLPLIVIAAALGAAAWAARADNAQAVTAFRISMGLVVATGLLGVIMHSKGSREFQIEMDPTLTGWALLVKVMRAKAPPTLAPAAMVQTGLFGLLYTWRHPALGPGSGVRGDECLGEKSQPTES
jgi:hypothetical protein